MVLSTCRKKIAALTGGIMHDQRPTSWQTNRRAWLRRSGLATASLTLLSPKLFADSADGISRTAESIHQETLFKAPPNRIYEILTDAAQFQKVELLSAAMKDLDLKSHPAVISREAGGAFSLFGDYVTGRQIELVPNQRIVQAWRPASWRPGIFSIAHFELQPEGSNTKLIFDHTGFPTGQAEHLAAGWHGNYWDPLKQFLAA
jgi:activator of HSP90 ATPase